MSDWKSLFVCDGGTNEQAVLRVLSRRGEPFLFLPQPTNEAIEVLSLYPAQTRVARIIVSMLTAGLHLRLPIPLAQLRLPIESGAPFVRFLSSVAGFPPDNPDELPIWGMLAGNPGAQGRRFVFLIFGPDGSPCAVVKTGLGAAAEALIVREAEALRTLPMRMSGVCPLLGFWEDRGAKAIALPFVAGETPSSDDDSVFVELLMNWLSHGSPQPLAELDGWLALRQTGFEDEIRQQLPKDADEIIVRSPVAHGDLAPWNIKSHEGRWTVIDWERGTLRGVPGWDWFHYILQPGVLVQKWDAQTLVDEAKRVLGSEPFQRYAEAARIRGLERALLLGYLVHCTEVIRQGEGRDTLLAAREILAQAWGVPGSAGY